MVRRWRDQFVLSYCRRRSGADRRCHATPEALKVAAEAVGTASEEPPKVSEQQSVPKKSFGTLHRHTTFAHAHDFRNRSSVPKPSFGTASEQRLAGARGGAVPKNFVPRRVTAPLPDLPLDGAPASERVSGRASPHRRQGGARQGKQRDTGIQAQGYQQRAKSSRHGKPTKRLANLAKKT